MTKQATLHYPLAIIKSLPIQSFSYTHSFTRPKTMAALTSSFLVLCLSFLSVPYSAHGQERAPHGLANESPMVLSPSAIEFFHPKSTNPADGGSPLSPPSLSTFSSSTTGVAESSLAHESKLSKSTSSGGSRVGIGGLVGIVFGFILVLLLAMGVYYVVVTRQTNATRADNSIAQLPRV